MKQSKLAGCCSFFFSPVIFWTIIIVVILSWPIMSSALSSLFQSGQRAIQTAVATADTQATQEALTPTPTPAPPPGSVDLLTAEKQQLVTVSFQSTGGASGDVINITLKRLKAPADSDLIITLPPGLILANSDPSQQNMVLLRPTEMELAPQATDAQVGATAFCATLHKDNPTNGTGLTLSGQGSPDLVSLIKAELSRDDSILVIQAAVWAITDNATRDDLNQVGYGLSDQDLQSVRDLLRAAGLNPANYQLTS